MTQPPVKLANAAQEASLLPKIYFKLTDTLISDECQLNDIVSIIQPEPTIAASLFKIANCKILSFPRQVNPISKLLILLGLSQIKKLIDSYRISDKLPDINAELIAVEKHWEMSIECALICHFIAQRKQMANADNIFLSGLFHHLGVLAITHNAADAVRFCERYTAEETPWHVRPEALSFMLADCSTLLQTQWDLPLNLVTPIKELNVTFQKKFNTPCYLLYIAARLAVFNSHPNFYSKKELIEQEIIDHQQLTTEDMDAAITFCNEQTLSLLAAFPVY